MALYRLLQGKSRRLFQTPGLVSPPWWRYCTLSSSTAAAQKSPKFEGGEAENSSSRSKKHISAKEQKAAAAESFVAKYMETHQGTFPKISHLRNYVGGSWNTAKEILAVLKGKMVGNPQLQNHSIIDTSDSNAGVTASEITTAQKGGTISEIPEVKNTMMSSTIDVTASEVTTAQKSETISELVDVKCKGGTISEIPEVKNTVMSSTIDVTASEVTTAQKSETISELVDVKCKVMNSETEKMTSASPTWNVSPAVGGKHSVLFGGPQKKMGSADLLARTGETTSERNDCVMPSSPSFVNEATGRGGEKDFGIMSLIDCIKEIPDPEQKSNPGSHNSIRSNNMDETSNKSAINRMRRESNSLRSDNGERNSPLHGQTMVKETNSFKGIKGNTHEDSLFELFSDMNPMRKDSKANGTDVSALGSIKSKSGPDILLPTRHDSKKTWNALLAEKEADDNKVLVRFLHAAVKRSEIETLFNYCGNITRIDVHHKGGLFKTACIYFKTKEGMLNALKKTGLRHRNTSLIVEAVCSKDNILSKTSIPNLIGYPEVPASFVKNPTRTVMIKQLTPDINSHDIEEALAFCGSKISGFFFGSSCSVAYVELETDEAKQRALERNSITISGKLLRIFRIDAPRTTVVRVSNLWYPEVQDKFQGLCASYGQVKNIVVRSKGIVDVYFDITEWPNMLGILNRLNGLQVYNSQWIAQPAPVFPPEVLDVLWKHPDERRHLKTQIHRSMQKLEEYNTAHKVGLASLSKEYYGTACG